MNIQRRALLFVILGLAVWSTMATLTATYYYTQYIETRKTFEELKSLVINVNVLMDYGNGTQYWHNETIAAGSTAFDALLAVTKKMEYATGQYGVLVTSIDGLKNVGTSSGNTYSGNAWFWYHLDESTSKWAKMNESADSYILKPDDSIAWRYESYSF